MSYKLKSLLLSCISALLLWVAWPPHNLGWIGFIALLPLLVISDFYKKEFIPTWYYRLIIYLGLLLWNILTTWWIWNASAGGAIAAIVLNTVMMSMVWWAYAGINKKSGATIGLTFLISFWMAFELFHLNWDGTWPWLVLGNIFANNTALIQWYEYTGHLGGSLWILLVNVFIFRCYQTYAEKSLYKRNLVVVVLLIVMPIGASLLHYELRGIQSLITLQHEQINNTLIIQPNLDPYSEKFSNEGTALSPKLQLERMLQMAEEKINDATELVILPETALQGAMRDSELKNEPLIFRIREFVFRHPFCCVITGATTYTSYETKATESSRQLEAGGQYFDFFNTALKIDTSATIEIYHKSRLVPGVEKLPYPIIFGPLVRLLNLEAQAGGLGVQQEASVFTHHGFKIAPLICYESVFGGYVKDFVTKGSNVFVVITNDGWWGNTDGYQQHLEYGKLRCIEFRQELLQCANTGLSARINTDGEIEKQTGWWQQAVLDTYLTANNSKTFYAMYGDYIGWFGTVTSLSILAWFFAKRAGFRNS